MATEVARLRAYLDADTRDFDRKLSSANRTMEQTSSRGHRAFGALGTAAKAGFVAAGAAAAVGGAAIIKTGLEFASMKEQAQIAFTTMLGSGKRAKVFLDDLAAFAAKTPFEFQDLTMASQRLLAMGFQGKDVLPIMTSVGDAVAAIGGGSEQIDQATRALGQIQAKGRLQAEEMMQLNEAGVFSWKDLAREIGVSVPKAMEMVTAGQVDADEAVKAFTDNAGERFGGMMDKQSRTLGGLFSTFKDTFAQISGSIIEPFVPYIKTAMDFVIDHIGAVPDFINKKVIPGFQALAERGGGFIERVKDIVQGLWDFFKENLLPIIKELARIAVETFRRMAKVIEDNRPALERIVERLGKLVRFLAAVLLPIIKVVFQEVLPRVLKVVIVLIDDVSAAIETVVRWVGRLVDFVREHKQIFLGPFNLLKNYIENTVGFARDLFNAIKAGIDKVAGPLGKVADAFGKIKGAVSGAVSGVSGFFGDGVIGAGIGAMAGAGAGAISPTLFDDLALGQASGLTLSSGYRPNAVTSSGNPSLHGVYPSKAIDMMGSESAMRRFFLMEVARGALTGLREVIHSPYWWHPGSGIQTISDASVMAGHYSHVHVGSYDQGGYLRPGWNYAYNGTGRNEPVGFGGITVNVGGSVIAERDLHALIRRLNEEHRRRGGV